MQRALAILAALAAGCSSIGHEAVAGWPALEIIETYVPHAEMRERCVRYVGFGNSPEACAEFDLANRRCYIWYSADFPPDSHIVRHERLHCAGYDHPGSTGMARILHQYRAGGSAAAGASR